MRVIIAGSRSIDDYALVCQAIAESGFPISEVVCGMARGVDQLGRRWAGENLVPCVEYSADWDRYGGVAGRLRNERMAKSADALIAVWDGRSPGTAHMIRLASRLGLKIHAVRAG